MLKVIKWLAIVFAVLVIVVIVAVIIAPMVINLEKYKPRIEAEAAKALDRPVTLGGRIAPSVFPWVGMALSDVRIGNPVGFSEEHFVSVGEFEVRVRLLPLLSGNYEVKRFVLRDPSIVLEKNKSGRTNLEGLGQQEGAPDATPPPAPAPEEDPTSAPAQLPIKSLVVNEFAITNGAIRYIDHGTGVRHEVRELNLVLDDVSLLTPIAVDFRAVADGHPIALSGAVGPVGAEPGRSPIQFNLLATLLKQMKIDLQGSVADLLETPRLEMRLAVDKFSPRDLLADLAQPLPFETADPKALTALGFSLHLSGTPEAVQFDDGQMTLDESRITFSGRARAFDKPDIALEAELDRIDLDRYLPPPPPEKEGAKAPETAPASRQEKPDTDYTPLRQLVLDARLAIGQAKLKNVRIQNMALKATANNGIIRLDPVSLDLYNGRVTATTTINVQQRQPRSNADLAISTVQAGPFLKDLLDKELIDGLLTAAINLRFTGDTADAVRKSLNGKGELNFNDGAIIGIDLADMVRNVQAAFALADKPTEKPRTDFTELAVPFSISDGLFRLDNARLNSPLLRLTAGGAADLVRETLDMRIEPRFVATLKGQGDTVERAGITVPVMVGGSFDNPRYRPDLKAILQQELPDREALEKMVPSKETLREGADEKARELIEEKGRDLLRGLPLRRQQQPADGQ
ncbi:AsmA family protein [Desulfatitalea alkaliphila]|uniref:AsmA family protein n=1 Tax=Desulfatitalea alkaliphila TaxID=2929485 RepID=A0AA41R3Y9_9BACT|nr:AsmA family protein [Desulfatitalea alkaliphila]MCJ8501562.1 AsmA family protein [Desulfatitalea alkaliphila]